MADNPRPDLGESIRSGLGILGAFRDALEETLQEAVERGDLPAERARQAMRDVAARAQLGLDEARQRLDVAPRHELDQLREQVEALRRRVDALEHRAARGPEAR